MLLCLQSTSLKLFDLWMSTPGGCQLIKWLLAGRTQTSAQIPLLWNIFQLLLEWFSYLLNFIKEDMWDKCNNILKKEITKGKTVFSIAHTLLWYIFLISYIICLFRKWKDTLIERDLVHSKGSNNFLGAFNVIHS